MLPQEAFKLGFLARCVEEGLSPEQTHGLAKQAAILDFLQNSAKATLDTGKSMIDLAKASVPLAMLGLAAPPAIGGLAAYMANKATEDRKSVV